MIAAVWTACEPEPTPVYVGLREIEVSEESIGHRCVVMLTSVKYKWKKVAGTLLHCGDDGRHFHEVWSGADNVDDLEHSSGGLTT